MVRDTYDHGKAEVLGLSDDRSKLRASVDRNRRQYRIAHPPIDCWIDTVENVELYQAGILRAKIERVNARISFLSPEGNTIAAMLYLRSEDPFEIVETHLGIGRVDEIRDESDEAEDPISALPRDISEREAGEFANTHRGVDEVFFYLHAALRILEIDHDDPDVMAARTEVLEAIAGLKRAALRMALTHVQRAIVVLESRSAALFAGAALIDCRRSLLALERHVAGL